MFQSNITVLIRGFICIDYLKNSFVGQNLLAILYTIQVSTVFSL